MIGGLVEALVEFAAKIVDHRGLRQRGGRAQRDGGGAGAEDTGHEAHFELPIVMPGHLRAVGAILADLLPIMGD